MKNLALKPPNFSYKIRFQPLNQCVPGERAVTDKIRGIYSQLWGTREHGNREQKRGIFGVFPCFWENGELPGDLPEPHSLGICNEDTHSNSNNS